MDGLEPTAKQTELQSLSAIDTLTSAMKSNIVPNQEYLLQGSILDAGVDILLHRLRGLCDNTDVGLESFHDHEACFMLFNPSSTQPSQPLTLRVRKAVDDTLAPYHLRYVSQVHFPRSTFGLLHSRNMFIHNDWWLKWHLKLQFEYGFQMGQPELGDKNRPTMVRSVLDIGVGSDIVEFLKELGCRREFDFITKGFIFRKGRLKIIVGKLYRYEAGKPLHELDPVTGSHYVEMSVVTPTGQDIVGEDMRNLAEQLKPLVNLDKVDHRRLP